MHGGHNQLTFEIIFAMVRGVNSSYQNLELFIGGWVRAEYCSSWCKGKEDNESHKSDRAGVGHDRRHL